MTSILWLHKPRFTSQQKWGLSQFMERRSISPSEVFYWNPAFKIKNLQKTVGKRKVIFNPEKRGEFENELQSMVEKLRPKVIVCNDDNLCEFFTGNRSLNLCRGFVYRWRNLPVIVVDDYLSTHKQKHAGWLLHADLAMLRRWVDGSQRNEPAFNYTICKNSADLEQCNNFANAAYFAAVDCETAGSFITSISFTMLRKDGAMRTFIIPFYSTQTSDGAYWEREVDEIFAWEVVREICDGEILLGFQNGAYDCMWLLRYNIPCTNFFLDSLHLFHSIWCEAPKKLNNISSFCLDFAQFWKDESKGDKQDVKKYGSVPIMPDGYQRYLRYNGLDTHYTALDIFYLLNFMVNPKMKWALDNYYSEFRDQIGPAFSMSSKGLRVSNSRRLHKKKQLTDQREENLAELRIMCDDPELNPESSAEMANIIYDVLGASRIQTQGKTKFGERSIDKRVLRLIRPQHPLFAWYIDKLWATKEPQNNITKYIDLWYPGWRFLYSISALTETSRYRGGSHQYWYGTNPQNIPNTIRDMYIADPGTFFLNADYRQADAWFIAMESLDPLMMEELEGDQDAHCLFAAFIFQEDYGKLYKAYIEDDDWAVHPIEGRRQNAKRIKHGANYWMAGFALYMLLGREAVVATAFAMGEKSPWQWEQKQLVSFCSVLLSLYYKRYGRFPEWFKEACEETIANGNRATCFGGYTRLFFGEIASDNAIQRELASFFGQGGTGGLMRRSALELYYKSGMINNGVEMMLQVHDNFLFQIKNGRNDLCRNILTIMERPCTIRGREFVVPADAKCGLSWGRSMMKWNDNVGIEDMRENEERWEARNYV